MSLTECPHCCEVVIAGHAHACIQGMAVLRAEVADLRAREKAADDYARQIRNDVSAIRARLLVFERDLERIAGIDKHPFLHIGRLLTAISETADAIERAAHPLPQEKP